MKYSGFSLLLVLMFFTEGIAQSHGSRTICPAVDWDLLPRTNNASEPDGALSAVVVAKFQPNEEDSPTRTFRGEVSSVLLGGQEWKGKTIEVKFPWEIPIHEESIVALMRQRFDPNTLYLKYEHPASLELENLRAMTRAHLDFHTSDAERIVVGRSGGDIKVARNEIMVSKVVLGDPGLAGSALAVLGNAPATPTENEITWTVLQKRLSKGGGANKWETIAMLSGDCDREIKESLVRIQSYPVNNRTLKNGATESVREIIFQGSLSEAIALLGSENEGAVQLGIRRLLRDSVEALPLLIEKAEEELLSFEKGESFSQLHKILGTIGAIDGEEGGALDGLIRQLISYIEKGGRPPEERVENPDLFYPEYDVNHALSWALNFLKDEGIQVEFARQLLALRDKPEYEAWHREIEFALIESGVDDKLQLQEARRASDRITPVILEQNIVMRGQYVGDWAGDYVVMAGDGRAMVWNRKKDWALFSEFSIEGAIYDLRIFPDRESILIAGEAEGGLLEERSLHDGRILRHFFGHTGQVWDISFTNDRKKLISTGRKEIIEWDWATGKEVKRAWKYSSPGARGIMGVPSTVLDQISSAGIVLPKTPIMAVSGDGSRISWTPEKFSTSGTVSVYGFPELKEVSQLTIPGSLSDTWVRKLIFSPDGTQLLVLLSSCPPMLFDIATGNSLLCGKGHCGGVDSVCFTEDGTRVITVGKDRKIGYWSADNLALEKKIDTPFDQGWISSHPIIGRYALFDTPKVEVIEPDPFGGAPDPFLTPAPKKKTTATFFDLEKGQVLSRFESPSLWDHHTKTNWIGNDRFMVSVDKSFMTSGGGLRQLNILTGEEIYKGDRLPYLGLHVENDDLPEVSDEITAGGFVDGSYFVDIDGGFRTSRLWLTTIRSSDFQIFAPISRSLPRTIYSYHSGLVPGGRRIYFEGLILDRKTLETVSDSRFPDDWLGRTVSMAFSHDGKKFAVSTRRNVLQSRFSYWPAGEIPDGFSGDSEFVFWNYVTSRDSFLSEEKWIRIHDVETGKTMHAFPAVTDWTKELRFSPDGQRLAELGDDGTLAVWNLSRNGGN